MWWHRRRLSRSTSRIGTGRGGDSVWFWMPVAGLRRSALGGSTSPVRRHRSGRRSRRRRSHVSTSGRFHRRPLAGYCERLTKVNHEGCIYDLCRCRQSLIQSGNSWELMTLIDSSAAVTQAARLISHSRISFPSHHQIPMTSHGVVAARTSDPTPEIASARTAGVRFSACQRRSSGPFTPPVTFTLSSSIAEI